MTREEAIKLLEKEKEYMISHGGDLQADALGMAIKALEQEPCEDCVSRQALISAFPISDTYTLDDIIASIKFQPPVTPTRKKGKWIKGCTAVTGDGLAQTYDCSECGSYWYKKFNYCPNCGAEMESEE